jgi:hypothetical protein
VFRVLLVAALLSLAFETSGLGALLGDGPCSEDCPTDRSGGQCAPNCRFCSCCSTPRTALLGLTEATPILTTARVAWAPAPCRPSSPDPRAILHVPKRAHA